MPDLSHLWGNDLALSATGDLATTDTPGLTQQRVLRRLLTNPGDYIWTLDYGAGLGRFVGQPGALSAVRSAIRGQIFKESSVASNPEPVIDVHSGLGGLYVHIRYADAATGITQTLAFAA